MEAVRRDNVVPLIPSEYRKKPLQWKRWAASAAVLAVILIGAGGLRLSHSGSAPQSAGLASVQENAAAPANANPENGITGFGAAAPEARDAAPDSDAAKAEGQPSTGLTLLSSSPGPGTVPLCRPGFSGLADRRIGGHRRRAGDFLPPPGPPGRKPVDALLRGSGCFRPISGHLSERGNLCALSGRSCSGDRYPGISLKRAPATPFWGRRSSLFCPENSLIFSLLQSVHFSQIFVVM